MELLGKIIIEGSIKVITGLRIGGLTTGLKIGGVDHPVISDAFGKPYIPGSSLKGKLRSLIEKKENVILNIFIDSLVFSYTRYLIERKH